MADPVVLAPGASVTILDAANPSVRLILTAPPEAPLDLSPLLSLKPDESVYSIVTRMQTKGAGAMTMNADGSVSLSAAAPARAAAPTRGLAGGVLVFDAGRWTLHPAAASSPGAVAPAQQTQRATISKPGATKEQAERDIAQCRQYAQQAAAKQMTAADKASTYNGSMYSCLRGFGYEIRG